MIVFRDLEGRSVEALADYYGQDFPVGPAFELDRYKAEPHYGIDYRLRVTVEDIDVACDLNFQCLQRLGGDGTVNGFSVEQVLSTVMDHLHKTDPNRPMLHYLRLAWWAAQRDEQEGVTLPPVNAGDANEDIGYGAC